MGVKKQQLTPQQLAKGCLGVVQLPEKRRHTEGKPHILQTFKIPECLEEERPRIGMTQRDERVHRFLNPWRDGYRRPGSSVRNNSKATPSPATGSRIAAYVSPTSTQGGSG